MSKLILSPYRSGETALSTTEVKQGTGVATATPEFIRIGALLAANGNLGEPQLAYTTDGGVQRRLGYMEALSRTNGTVSGSVANPTTAALIYQYTLNGRLVHVNWQLTVTTTGAASGTVILGFPVADIGQPIAAEQGPHNCCFFDHTTTGSTKGIVQQRISPTVGGETVLTFLVMPTTGAAPTTLVWGDVPASLSCGGEFSFLNDIA